jgi:hypothetical protein
MRLRGVARADLERLHAAALAANAGVEQGRDSPAEAESVMQGSASISHRIHEPLLGSLNDLVHAIVILLLLSIPFAFAMERLVIGATSVYGRIAGFALIFGVTFALLYATHPGFALSSTPMIIFLAFAVLLLSSAVIAIVLRKFDAELKAMQGRSATIHAVETSRIGTMLAAAGMGISTMKRRRTRTLLSAVTVVTLTFAVLCFASLTRELGVRVAYEGPVADGMPAGLLAHRMDYTALPSGAQDLMHPEAGDGGLLAVQWWRTRQAEGDPPLTAVNPASGAAVALDAALGLHPDEPARWPALGECLDGGEHAEWLRRNGVYLPAAVADLLGLARGDAFLLEGKRVVFAGLLRSAGLQRLRNLDNRPVLPVDFREAGLGAVAAAADDPSAGALARADSDRNFKRLGVEQVAVVSDRLARSLGGNPHVANLYPGGQTDLSARARKLAALLSMPVWSAGANGVDRSLLTVLTGVSGGLALGVPLVLGGLIIFGSLLGSITDRQKEIYTFSALGLSPGHVGLLFFAEAAVYAVVGGMGGQLLAQGVGWAASRLAARGVIEPVSINFSSTHSLFAMGAVMAVVLVSAVYPAIRASRSANPGLARSWRMPSPAGDRLAMTFPFTVSANDIAGVIAFLAEHFRSHDDAGLGAFAASEVIVCRGASGRVELRARLALAPFDLGVTESFVLGSVPSEIEGVDEVRIGIERISGARGDWIRGNRVFIRGLRVQFLAWRTLAPATMEQYRAETLAALGEDGADCRMTTEPAAGGAEG